MKRLCLILRSWWLFLKNTVALIIYYTSGSQKARNKSFEYLAEMELLEEKLNADMAE